MVLIGWGYKHDMLTFLYFKLEFSSISDDELPENGLMDGHDALQVPIFEKGYEKDPAMVAKEAIREAVRTQQDVVLVDTAGRMQVQLACLRLSFSHTVCTVTLEPFFRK